MSRLLSLLCVLALCALPCVLASSGRLLVQKTLDHHLTMPHNFAHQAPINVSLTVLNAGDGPAFEVLLEDNWSEGFEVASAKAKGPYEWAVIQPGQSVSVEYIVTPTITGPFESAPARISYTPMQGAPKQIGYSSSVSNLNVIDVETYSKLTNTFLVEWLIFAGLLSVFVLAPAAKWYELSSSYVKGGRRKGE